MAHNDPLPSLYAYHVSWGIELDAENPEAAARAALTIQRNPSSIATVFRVRPHQSAPATTRQIDLGDMN